MTATLALVVLVVLAVGCAEGRGTGPGQDGAQPRLRLLGAATEFGLGIPRVPRRTPWVVQGLVVCLDPGGSVELVEVRAVDANLQVEGFALRDNPMWSDGDSFGRPPQTDRRGPLTRAGFDPDQTVASHDCEPTKGQGHELAVQLSNPSGGRATSQGFEVVYRSEGEEKTLEVPMRVALCAARWRPCQLGD